MCSNSQPEYFSLTNLIEEFGVRRAVGWVQRIPIFAQISKQRQKRNPTYTPQPLGCAFLQISKRPYKILTTLHPTYYFGKLS
jgi:hypothetical protein